MLKLSCSLCRCRPCPQRLLPWCPRRVCAGEGGHCGHQRRLAEFGSHLRGAEAVHQRCADGRNCTFLWLSMLCFFQSPYGSTPPPHPLCFHSTRIAWRNSTSTRTPRCCCTWRERFSNAASSKSANRCCWRYLRGSRWRVLFVSRHFFFSPRNTCPFSPSSTKGPSRGAQRHGADVQRGPGASAAGHSGAERWEKQPEGSTECCERAGARSQVLMPWLVLLPSAPSFQLSSIEAKINELKTQPIFFSHADISATLARLETRWGLTSLLLRPRPGEDQFSHVLCWCVFIFEIELRSTDWSAAAGTASLSKARVQCLVHLVKALR